MKKQTIIGWALIVLGLVMLFRIVRVMSFGFYRIGNVNTSAIVLVLLIVAAIAVVVKRNRLTIGCLIGCVCLLVLSLLLGTQLYIAHSSLLDVLLVFVPIVIGAGLVIGSTLKRE